MSQNLRKTPLHGEHVKLGSKLADFGGWEMPIEYSGVVSEHTAVRTSCGIFDVSHMGKLRIQGKGVAAELSDLLASKVSALEVGQAQYSMLLNAAGGVVDDLIVYRLGESDFWIVPNASNATEVFQILKGQLSDAVEIENLHESYGILAIQGSGSAAIMQKLGIDPKLEYMQARYLTNAEQRSTSSHPSLICRSGYTGEFGFELIVPIADVLEIFSSSLVAGATPAGLGARDTLRLEMGYPLHGQEISQSISPVSAGLSWAIDWDGNFIGKEPTVQARQQPESYRVGLKLLERGVLRSHLDIYLDGNLIGETTSGSFSPTLKVGIALALVERKMALGEKVEVDVRGRRLSAEVVRIPFVESKVK
jgi:aminomethyltransferase